MADVQETAFFIGDVALDDYYTAERWPGLADKADIRENKSYVGGMIANAASVHAGLGGHTEFISLLNHSDLSRRLCDELNRLDVATTHMLHDAGTANSHNMIFLVGGEHVVLIGETGNAPMQLPAPTLEALRKPGYLYSTISRSKRLRGDGLAGALLLADLRAHGRKLVFDLDVDGFVPADVDYLRGADIVIMNEIGFGLAFGTTELAAINDWMREHQVRIVIRTLAAAGAEAYDGSGIVKVAGYDVPVVDVTGAGDTFGGALVYAIDRSPDLTSALEFAVAAASRAVTIEGPQGGVATVETIEQFRSEHSAARRA
jgi:sugar/nucleoside kinase (ribokinase family)